MENEPAAVPGLRGRRREEGESARAVGDDRSHERARSAGAIAPAQTLAVAARPPSSAEFPARTFHRPPRFVRKPRCIAGARARVGAFQNPHRAPDMADAAGGFGDMDAEDGGAGKEKHPLVVLASAEDRARALRKGTDDEGDDEDEDDAAPRKSSLAGPLCRATRPAARPGTLKPCIGAHQSVRS